MHHLLIMVAISEFLTATEAKYALLRDNALSQHGKYRPRALNDLRQSFLSESLNLLAVHRDAVSFANRSVSRRNVNFQFRKTPREQIRGQQEDEPHPLGLLETLANEHDDRFRALLEADRGYRELFATAASLGASADSYRISRLALWVAIASVGVALATIGVELIPAEILESLWKWTTSSSTD